MPEPAPRDDGPISRKIFRKRMKYGSPGLHFGALWGSVGPAGGALGDFVGAFGFNRQCAGSVISDFDGKVCFVDFDAILERNCCLCRSGRRSWSPSRIISMEKTGSLEVLITRSLGHTIFFF